MNVEPPVGPFVSIFRLLCSIVGTTFLATVCSDSVNFVRSSTTASLDLGEILSSDERRRPGHSNIFAWCQTLLHFSLYTEHRLQYKVYCLFTMQYCCTDIMYDVM